MRNTLYTSWATREYVGKDMAKIFTDGWQLNLVETFALSKVQSPGELALRDGTVEVPNLDSITLTGRHGLWLQPINRLPLQWKNR